MDHVSDLPFELPPSKALVTDEGRIAAQLANLPPADQLQKMAAAVVVQAARDIVLGKLQFRSAGEASKVARDFVAIAKEMVLDSDPDGALTETADDRKELFEALRKKAQEKLSGG